MTKVLAGRGEFCTPSQYSKSSPVAIHSARSPSQDSAASPWPAASAVPQVGHPASTYSMVETSTPCAASIGSTMGCQAAEPSRIVRPSTSLMSAGPSPLRNASEKVSSAPMWKTLDRAIPFCSAKENTPGEGKPMSAWPTSTNLTVAVPSDGPGCISTSSPSK